jgi:long-chain-fatty-acid--CoA ligase ACSBG
MIDNPSPSGEGEVCMRGRNRFMGYLKNPEASASTIDAAGWLHSGDLGTVSSDGFLRITGRIKELIITAGGENVAPVLIEDCIKQQCSAISNVMLVGDRRKFVTALIALKTEPDTDGNPTRQLSQPALTFASTLGSAAVTSDAAAACTLVQKGIAEAVAAANKHAISTAARVQKWTIIPQDFS